VIVAAVILPATVPVVSGNSPNNISTQEVHLLKLDGIATSAGIFDHQYQINTVLQSNIGETRSFVVLIEVRDSSGITTNLFWQSGTLAAGKNQTIGVSWIPGEACSEGIACRIFQIRTFVISSLEDPMVLSYVFTKEVAVVGPSDYFHDVKLYKVSIGSELHNILYSLDSGAIVKVQKATATGPIEITLQGVERDGDLIIRLPAPVVHYAFYLDAVKILNGLRAYYPSVLVNDVELVGAEVMELRESESITFRIPLEAGTERIVLRPASWQDS
jgi:hypothetical protein